MISETQEISTGYVPRPYQAVVHVLMASYRFAVLCFHRRAGKCLSGDTVVPTPKGTSLMKDLKVGDMVFTPNGTPTKVVGTYSNGVQDTYRITFDNGQKIETDADHLWYVEEAYSTLGKQYRTPWAKGDMRTTLEIMKEMVKDSSRRFFIPTSESVEYIRKSKELPIDPWLFGYWLGNGDKDQFNICVPEKYRIEIGERVKAFGPTSEKGGVGCFYLYFSEMKDTLRSLGVLNNKHIPELYKKASREDRISLVKGLMDADGSTSNIDGVHVSPRFSNSTKELVYDLKDVLSSLGEIVNVRYSDRPDKIKKVKSGIPSREYTLTFTPKNFVPFTLPCKIKGCRINTRPLRHKIVKVEKLDKRQEFLCIRVEDSKHLFLCSESFIPTHNTVCVINEIIDKALTCQKKNPQYAYIAPTYQQAKRIAWGYFKEYTKNIPNVGHYEGEIRIVIPRPWVGDFATIFLAGSDNYDSLVGLYLDGAVLDEYSLQNPAIWTLVIRPALSDREGFGIFIGTARGNNHFYELFNFALAHPERWVAKLLTVDDTGVIPKAELEMMKEEMSEEQFRQEFYCDFNANTTNTYYGEYLGTLEREKRIMSVPYEPLVEVDTAWDLGIGDTTAIWFWQLVGAEKRFIDYYECSSEDLAHFARILKEKPYTYGTHYLPHDAKARSLETGNSREEALRSLRIGRLRVLPKLHVEDGIHAARMVLKSGSFFDRTKCERGLSALRNYQKKWDGTNKIYMDKPLHDWSSNGADAFRYAALAIRPKQDIIKNKNYQSVVDGDYAIYGG